MKNYFCISLVSSKKIVTRKKFRIYCITSRNFGSRYKNSFVPIIFIHTFPVPGVRLRPEHSLPLPNNEG